MLRRGSVIFPMLLAALALSCSSAKRGSSTSPYATEDQFCDSWAKAACNAKVVEACAAKDAAACQAKAASYCLGLVPPNYASKYAKQCVEAVKSAFSDAKLTAAELAVVRDGAAPCDRLNEGPKGEGDSCSASDECNALLGTDEVGLSCIVKAGQTQGTCQVPVEVGGGFSCTEAAQTCATGFYCDGSNCLARKGDGQTCDPDTPCLEDYQCLGTTGDMKCAPKADTLSPCSSDDQCKSGICAKPATSSGKCVDSVILAPTEPLCAYLG